MFDVPKPVPYADQLKEQRRAQTGHSREYIKDQLEANSEAIVDLDELIAKGKAVQHHWVERGLKMSCEGAGHPTHAVFKRL